ncbi:MAG: acyl-CoA thioesterase [Rikenellaceae bacterium]|jgi:acyl-CoA thioester hydrolase|nr:acyl-CoA thioesterase [Rikenellaceae bacterium]
MVETAIQMRFADVDQLGHVNNVNLQHYFDVGKTGYYDRVLGRPVDWRRNAFIQRATVSEFVAQTRYAEPLVVRSKVEKIGTTSFTMYQEIVNPETEELKAFSRSTLIMFDFIEQHKIPMPEAWRKAISAYEGQDF